MIGIFRRKAQKQYKYRCKYNELPKCYETPCKYCQNKECQVKCGADCDKCPGLIKEELHDR